MVWCVDVEEFREVHRSKGTHDLKGEEQNPEINAIFGAREPVMLLKDRSDVIDGSAVRVYEWTGEGDQRKAVVVDVGCNRGANKNGSEGQVQVVDVT